MKASGTFLRIGILTGLLVPLLQASDDLLTLSTPSGNVTGIGVSVAGLSGAKTYQFRKIPYAKPPIGELRFAKTEPYGSWSGTLDATTFGPSCMQPMSPQLAFLLPNSNISEDCLFLNIYVPNGYDSSKNKTVMVWIHGGGFQNGQGMLYDPAYMAVKGDVIAVTINYRLNIFGFLTLKDNVLKGNYGLWDQILALKWIQSNIFAFGGDSASVTIYGESAGGFSVGLLSLIPSNKGLFKRVIAQSGVASSYVMTRRGVAVTIAIGKVLNCDASDSNAFLQCLRGKSSLEILNATNEVTLAIPSTLIVLIGLAPVVDNELFTDLPENLMRDKSSEASKFFRSIDYIVGNVNSEGSLFLGTLMTLQLPFHFNASLGLPYNVFCEVIAPAFTRDYFNNVTKVKAAICTEYGVKSNISEQAQQAVEMYTDLFFISPSFSTLRYHEESRSAAKRYQYIFTKDPAAVSFGAYPSWFRGAGHADELFYLFDFRDLVQLNISQDDLKLLDAMVTYWANFAKTGDPNSGNQGVSLPTWPQFNNSAESYIILDTDIKTGSKYKEKRMKIWLKDIPKLLTTSDGTSRGSILTLPSFLCYSIILLLHII